MIVEDVAYVGGLIGSLLVTETNLNTNIHVAYRLFSLRCMQNPANVWLSKAMITEYMPAYRK